MADAATIDELPELPERPVDPDWLALREPADARARDAAAGLLLAPLLDHFRARFAPDGAGSRPPVSEPGVRVVDLGAGTGANVRWLAPRLAALGARGALDTQRWTLLDHDPRLAARGPVPFTVVRADVAELPRLLAGMGAADLITAAALLDLLDGRALAAVVEAVVTAGVPALFSLSVTGTVTLDPPDPFDRDVAVAFDAHQRRGGRLGPDAGHRTADLFRDQGWGVLSVPTPWQLGPGEPDLMRAWLTGRAEAAVEWRPGLAEPARAWLERRDARIRAGALHAVVDHLDVLAVPGATAAGRPGREPRDAAET